MKKALLVVSLIAASAGAQQPPLPAGYWTPEKSGPILEKTQTIRLAPDLSSLTAGEQEALRKLLQVGEIFQKLYEDSRHRQALAALVNLEGLDKRLGSPRSTQNLIALYRLFQGPIATTLENQREAFLPVDPVVPGKNVYPWGITQKEMDAFLAGYPKRRDEILDVRTVVRRSNSDERVRDAAMLQRHQVLNVLHPGLKAHLEALGGADNRETLYAVPYAVEWAEDLARAYKLLREAATAVATDDPDFSRYLHNRARDLLANDYESGDASWVTGDFKRLNAQLGSYEVYDDELMGVKSFFAASILLRNEKQSTELRRAIQGLQEFENSLPYDQHKKVREDIPVGVYDVIADFGQARGTNTATILPNESNFARKYGRIILLRANIMRNPDLFERSSGVWRTAVSSEFENDLGADGDFYRTLWHEIGHYLGVDRDHKGRELDEALQENSSLLEEMKADLVSLFLVPELRRRNYYTDAQVRFVYAAGIRRVLQNVKPRRDQPYQTMQLMQMNYYLDHGLLAWDPAAGELRINYERYHEVVGALLKEVLAIQHAGDKAAADRFIEKWTSWRNDLHEALAAKIRAQQKYRFTLVSYAALGE